MSGPALLAAALRHRMARAKEDPDSLPRSELRTRMLWGTPQGESQTLGLLFALEFIRET